MMRRGIPILLTVLLLAPVAWAGNGITFSNAPLADGWLAPGVWSLVQRIEANGAATVSKVTLDNTTTMTPLLIPADIQRVEVRRADGRVLGWSEPGAWPVEIEDITTNNVFSGPFSLYVWVKVKASATLNTHLSLGSTDVTYNPNGNVIYTAPASPAATFTVTGGSMASFDGSVTGGPVYRGQRFLAARIRVDALTSPNELTISQIVLWNIAPIDTRLVGTHIDRIEIRRASDDALLRQETNLAGIDGMTGKTILTSSNNKIAPHSTMLLDVWVTLKANAPAQHRLQLGAQVRLGPVEHGVTGQPPWFVVDLPGGFEEIQNLDTGSLGGQVFSGQRFLAQRILCRDSDIDPFNVTVTSLWVQNVAVIGRRLAENQIEKMEAIRARDGELMGSVSSAAGLNSGGLRITTPNANVVADDTAEIYEIWITLKDSVPHDRDIRLETSIWHTEDGSIFGGDHPHAPVSDSAVFTTGPDGGEGFEHAVNDGAVQDRQVFQGARVLMQRIRLEDNDADPYDVHVTSVMVRNTAGNPLADQYVARLEVRRRSDGALLGEVADPVGLSLAGVRVTTAENNLVPDDGKVELEIWVTLKQTVPAGRRVSLQSDIWHTEGTADFQTGPIDGATFTTKIGTPPQNVNFNWAPSKPSTDDEVTFTPASNITDPEGSIAKATFHWAFGDGNTKTTTGSSAVKHTYETAGTYTATLTVTGEEGISTTRSNDVAVTGPPNQPPAISNMAANPQNPAVDEAISFSATVTDPDHPQGPFTYAWDFGDGETSDVASPSHTYTEAGTYEVTLTVTDPEGASATETLEIIVGNEPPTLAGVTATPAAVSTGDPVEFRATGYADPDGDALDRCEWDLGDGTIRLQGGLTETHIYTAPGTYTVSVVAVDERGGRSAARTVQVTVSGRERAVMHAFPNPARTSATIAYFLPEGATEPELQIFDLAGRRILRKMLPAGQTSYAWDLRDEDGTPVASGLYFCMIVAKGANNRTITSPAFRLLITR